MIDAILRRLYRDKIVVSRSQLVVWGRVDPRIYSRGLCLELAREPAAGEVPNGPFGTVMTRRLIVGIRESHNALVAATTGEASCWTVELEEVPGWRGRYWEARWRWRARWASFKLRFKR